MIAGTKAAPDAVIVHLTDTHLLAGGAFLAGTVDTAAHLRETAARIIASVGSADAIVVSGDVADLGEPEAYELAREILEPVRASLDAPLVWAAGNHDERVPFRAILSPTGGADDPTDAIVDAGRLRIVSFDSSIPGFHHGGFDAGQADWLRQALADPPPLGTVLVMHHPPLPYRSDVMQLIDFRDDEELAGIIENNGVRAILAGHLHVSGSGTLAGVPVFVGGATSYVDDLGAPPTSMRGIDDTQSFGIVEIFADRVNYWVAPGREYPFRQTVSADLIDRLRMMPASERSDAFSRKRP